AFITRSSSKERDLLIQLEAWEDGLPACLRFNPQITSLPASAPSKPPSDGKGGGDLALILNCAAKPAVSTILRVNNDKDDIAPLVRLGLTGVNEWPRSD
ncbi:MAG: hypothetical protein ACK542_03990, partial [Burkholderiales bacterium]